MGLFVSLSMTVQPHNSFFHVLPKFCCGSKSGTAWLNMQGHLSDRPALVSLSFQTHLTSYFVSIFSIISVFLFIYYKQGLALIGAGGTNLHCTIYCYDS